MKNYRPHIKRAIVPLIILTWVFVSFLYTSISMYIDGMYTQAVAVFLATLIFCGFYYLIYRWYFNPVVSINGNQISVQSMFTRVKTIKDVQSCSLVLNEKSLFFRRQNKQDIIVDKMDFSESKWGKLVEDLKLLPFSEIIK